MHALTVALRKETFAGWFCQLDPNVDVSKKGDSRLMNCLHQLGLSANLWYIVLIND